MTFWTSNSHIISRATLSTMFSSLIAGKLKRQHRAELDRKSLLYYYNILHERHNYTCTVTSWRQLTTIEANGDTHERIEFTAIPNVDALHFLTFWEGPGWDWPEKHKKNTRLHVSEVQVEEENKSRFDVTSYWLTQGRLKVALHLGEPVAKGKKIHVAADFSWPAKSLPFTQGLTDEFVKKFTPGPQALQYTIVLPPGCSAHFDSIGLKNGAERYSIQRRINSNKREEVSLTAHRVTAGARVGMKLNIRDRSPST
ncbi:hypothetical protein ACWGE0_20070 [Lentzea sp. NPDC054927]